jgi:hypothetical protein
MKEFEVDQMSVSLIAGDDGSDRVALKVADGLDNVMVLTPAQARALATELITAVNRAEVKASLKTSPNMWRRTGNTPTRPVEAPSYLGEPMPRLSTAG